MGRLASFVFVGSDVVDATTIVELRRDLIHLCTSAATQTIGSAARQGCGWNVHWAWIANPETAPARFGTSFGVYKLMIIIVLYRFFELFFRLTDQHRRRCRGRWRRPEPM